MPNIAIIILVGFFLLVLVGGVFLFSLLKKETNKKTAEEGAHVANHATTQAFLPFKDIADSMIIMDNHEYRMMVECNSINYFLKTEEEQNAVEMSFRRFLNSIKFPFAFYIQTREIDNKEYIVNLQREIDTVLKTFPQLRDYAQNYIRELKDINSKLNNNKFKKKYIIVTYDEVGKMNHLNEQEKRDYAFEELYNRCKIVMSGLSNIGIKSHILDTSEIANVIYQSMHKEVGGVSDEIKDGSYLSLSVNGITFNTTNPLAKIDSIILEFENKLQTEIIGDKTVDTKYKNVADQLINHAEKMRSHAGAYFRAKKESDFNE